MMVRGFRPIRLKSFFSGGQGEGELSEPRDDELEANELQNEFSTQDRGVTIRGSSVTFAADPLIPQQPQDSFAPKTACSKCQARPAQKDGMCPPCRLSGIGRATRKYHFTPELTEELRAAYRLTKYPRARAIRKLMARTRWPKHAFQGEAIRLGMVTHHRRNWTAGEAQYLQEAAGRVSAKQIAAPLHRSVAAVESRIDQLQISRRDHREGYCVQDLSEVFGAPLSKVNAWMQRGLLGKVHQVGGLRVTEKSVMRFVRTWPAEYDLRRVDQVWFKSMLFAGVGELGE